MARLKQAPTPKPLRRVDVYSASETQDSDFDGSNVYEDILQLADDAEEQVNAADLSEITVNVLRDEISQATDSPKLDIRASLSATEENEGSIILGEGVQSLENSESGVSNFQDEPVSPVTTETLQSITKVETEEIGNEESESESESQSQSQSQSESQLESELESKRQLKIEDITEPIEIISTSQSFLTPIKSRLLDTRDRSETIFSEVSLVIDRFNDEVSRLESPAQYQSDHEDNNDETPEYRADSADPSLYVFTGEVTPLEPVVIEIVDSDSHTSDHSIKGDPDGQEGDPFGFSTIQRLRPKTFTSPTRKRFTPMEMLSKVMAESPYKPPNPYRVGSNIATPTPISFATKDYMPHRLNSMTPESPAVSWDPRKSASYVALSPTRNQPIARPKSKTTPFSVEPSPISRALNELPQRGPRSKTTTGSRPVNKGKQKQRYEGDYGDESSNDDDNNNNNNNKGLRRRSRQVSVDDSGPQYRSLDEYSRPSSDTGHPKRRKRQNFKSVLSRRRKGGTDSSRAGSEISEADESEISNIKYQLNDEFRLRRLQNLRKNQQEIDNWVLEIEAVSEG